MRVVGKHTQLVIDGFPRSANTFAVLAFRIAQAAPVDVAHHVHLPAQILAAAKRSLPTLLLIRNPDDVVTSLVLRFPHLSVAKGFRRYARFHRPLLPHAGALVVADFHDVVSNYGSVIRRLNERFGTTFTEFRHTPDNVERCLALIEEWDRGRFGAGVGYERRSARPSAQREEMKLSVRPRLDDPRLARVREDAWRLYEAFTLHRPPGSRSSATGGRALPDR